MILAEKEERKFPLKSDPTGDGYIIVRQATFGESRKLADLTAAQRQVVTDSPRGKKIAYEQDFNVYEERSAMIFLTAVEIGGFEKLNKDGEAEPMFSSISKENRRNLNTGMGAFQLDLDELPENVVNEMHQAVLTMNPQWLPNGTGS